MLCLNLFNRLENTNNEYDKTSQGLINLFREFHFQIW